MDKLPGFENLLSQETKMTLIYVEGYVVRNDGEIDDTFIYHEKYGSFINDLNRGGLTIPGDSACQWSFCTYVTFREVAAHTCRKSLCNILMMIFEFYRLNMNRGHAMIMSNILFKNHCHLYSPRSPKEVKQKVLKLS